MVLIGVSYLLSFIRAKTLVLYTLKLHLLSVLDEERCSALTRKVSVA